MFKNKNNINHQRQALLERHPDLVEYQIGQLNMFPWGEDYHKLARLVNDAWANTYDNQDRFDYGADYLQWVYGSAKDASVCVWGADCKDNPIGLFLGTRRTFHLYGRDMETCIHSALSVHPSVKGKGVAQLLYLTFQQIDIDCLAGFFAWYDITVKVEKPSHKILPVLDKDYYDPWGSFSLGSRVLSAERCFITSHMSASERSVLWALTKVWRQGKICNHNNTEKITESNIEECLQFLNNTTRGIGVGRIYSAQELARYACYHNPIYTFHSIGFLLRKLGNIIGLLIGYPLDVIGRARDRAFFVDMVCFADATTDIDRKAFLLECEEYIRQEFDPFVIMTLDGRLNWRLGYFPVGKRLVCYSLPFGKEFMKKQEWKYSFPPMDHK